MEINGEHHELNLSELRMTRCSSKNFTLSEILPAFVTDTKWPKTPSFFWPPIMTVADQLDPNLWQHLPGNCTI